MPGFQLPARWVIHTVGPVWQGGRRGEAALLASCYKRALLVADELGTRTVGLRRRSPSRWAPKPAQRARVRPIGGEVTDAETQLRP